MRKNRFLIVLAIILAASAPGTGAPSNDRPTPRVFPLEEFLRLAIERDTEFTAILIDRLALSYERALRLPAPDFVLEVLARHHFFLDPDRSRPEADILLSKAFPRAGNRVALNYRFTPSSDGTSDGSAAGVTFAQSIAENAFGRATRLLDRIVGLEVEIAEHQIIEAYEDYFATLVAAYYDWYEADENLKIAEAAYRTTEQLLENIKKREKSKIALPIDVNKARLQVYSKQETMVDLAQSRAARLNVIERIIREKIENVVPATPPIPETPDNYLATWHDMFVETSRTYKILDQLEAASALNVDREANLLLPSIDALIGWETEGEERGLADRESRAFAGVAAEWPIPGVVERARHRTAKIAREKTSIENENTRYRLTTRMQNLALQIEREKTLIELADQKIRLAIAVRDDEANNYSIGRVSLNDLIAAVNAIDTNRFTKISHEVTLRRLLLEFRRLTDVLVVESGIPTQPRSAE